MTKILWIDFGYFMFRSIYGWKNNVSTSPTFMCLNSIISNIRKVGLTPNDKVIVAVDSPDGNWRKEIDSNYKSNRKAKRLKQDIDWKFMFTTFQSLLETLESSTPFHIIIVKKMEADDIIAYGCKKFREVENIILSADSDYEQLYAYKGVKVYSPVSKTYKQIENPYRIILKKIKRETVDNLVTPILTLEDYKIREKLVNLVNLPEEVEDAIDPFLDKLHEKEWNYDGIKSDTLRQRIKDIYKQDRVIKIYQKGKKRKKVTKELDL